MNDESELMINRGHGLAVPAKHDLRSRALQLSLDILSPRIAGND